ncbi:MAG TPA: hypothetical protein VGI58_09435 [Streptosporangiaceae bacterium]
MSDIGQLDIGQLKTAIIGLIGLAATAEQELLAAAPAGEPGNPQRWAALPLIAHNTQFRQQQAERLAAIAGGTEPPEFADVDHQSAELYRTLAAQPAEQAGRESWAVAGELIDRTRSAAPEDLLDPARHPWLRGRQLWLQIIVRGFWHATGHVGDYYLSHGRAEQAVALASHAVATADYLAAPLAARGMAVYNLGCAQAGAGLLDGAAAAIGEAVTLNPDLRANTARDPDLTALRDSGRLAGVLAR